MLPTRELSLSSRAGAARPGASTGSTARLLAGAVLAAALLLSLFAAPASAHPMSTTAVLLDLDDQAATAEVQLPVDRLAVAFNQPLTAAGVLEPATLSTIRDYVRGHMTASDEAGRAWTTTVGDGRVERVDGVDHLVLDATLVPADGAVGDFTLHYDAILDRIVSHRIFVSARQGHSGTYTTLAMLSWQQQSVPVRVTKPSDQTGFLASLHLGVEHIRTGADHLLFLLMLLLPAPVLARARRWVPRDGLRRASWRVVHVVTAFAVGHSITLALGATGLLDLPTPLVESGIALSVLVSALHAIRPLVRQRRSPHRRNFRPAARPGLRSPGRPARARSGRPPRQPARVQPRHRDHPAPCRGPGHALAMGAEPDPRLHRCPYDDRRDGALPWPSPGWPSAQDCSRATRSKPCRTSSSTIRSHSPQRCAEPGSPSPSWARGGSYKDRPRPAHPPRVDQSVDAASHP